MIRVAGLPKASTKIPSTFTQLALVCVAVFAPQAGFAQADAATIAELRQQIAQLSARLEQLESDSREEPAEASNNWVNNISVSGDLRTRYENIDDATSLKDRNRNRLRARVDLSATVNDDWSASIGLASGGDDPISTNQTLGNAASTKDIRLDYAYFEYRGIDNLTFTGGKYKNVFYRPGGNAMLWDGDYRPEGLALRYSANGLFFNAATMILESDDRAGQQDKESMWGAQLGYRLAGLTFGAGYYDASVKGSNAFYNADLFGNSADNSGAFLYDYEELELFADYSFMLQDYEISLFGDYVENLDADTADTGWVIGAGIARALWELSYSYQNLEADAVFATFADSDYGGGGTDAKGHIVSAAYELISNTSVGFTYFMNEQISTGSDYDRLQVDLSVSF